jgi:hypothetical protein
MAKQLKRPPLTLCHTALMLHVLTLGAPPPARPLRPEKPAWRSRLHDFAVGSFLDNFILWTIVVNIMFMAMVRHLLGLVVSGSAGHGRLSFRPLGST